MASVNTQPLAADPDASEPDTHKAQGQQGQQTQQEKQQQEHETQGSEQPVPQKKTGDQHPLKEGDPGNSIPRRRQHRHPRLVRIVARIVQVVLAVEAAAWLYRTTSELRPRRTEGYTTSEETPSDDAGTRAADAADALVDYLTGRGDVEQLMGFGSEELLGAADELDTDDLDELGLSKEGGDKLKDSIRSMVEDLRKARQPIPAPGEDVPADDHGPPTSTPAAGMPSDQASVPLPTAEEPATPSQPGSAAQQQQQQQETKQQRTAIQGTKDKNDKAMRRFPLQKGGSLSRR